MGLHCICYWSSRADFITIAEFAICCRDSARISSVEAPLGCIHVDFCVRLGRHWVSHVSTLPMKRLTIFYKSTTIDTLSMDERGVGKVDR